MDILPNGTEVDAWCRNDRGWYVGKVVDYNPRTNEYSVFIKAIAFTGVRFYRKHDVRPAKSD